MIPYGYEKHLAKMKNAIFVAQEYRPVSCLNDKIVLYNVSDEALNFFKACMCVAKKPVKEDGGGLMLELPAGMTQLIPHFQIFIDNNMVLLRDGDMETYTHISKYNLRNER